MTGYGYNGPANSKLRIPDRLEYRTVPQDDVLKIDFPIGAELIVTRTRIYSLNHGKDKVRLRELHTPATQGLHP
jgi:hypothetical protein